MKNKHTGIYCIQNIRTGEYYIGASQHIKKRIKQHFGQLRCGKHINKKFQASYDQHGRRAFKHRVLELAPDEVAAETGSVTLRLWLARREADYTIEMQPNFNKTTRPPVPGRMIPILIRVTPADYGELVRRGNGSAHRAVRDAIARLAN